jgi:hypothetical protein
VHDECLPTSTEPYPLLGCEPGPLFEEFAESAPLAHVVLTSETVPVIEEQHGPLLQQVLQERKDGQGRPIEVTVDQGYCHWRWSQAVFQLVGEGVFEPTFDEMYARPVDLAIQLRSNVVQRARELTLTELAARLVDACEWRQTLERVEAEEAHGTGREMPRGYSHGMGEGRSTVETELEVVPFKGCQAGTSKAPLQSTPTMERVRHDRSDRSHSAIDGLHHRLGLRLKNHTIAAIPNTRMPRISRARI